MSLQLHQVSWKAGGLLILDDVSLAITPGSMVGLIGPNGSGKSSLLRLLAGLGRPSQGQVTLDDQPMADVSRRAVARQVAMVEQHASTEVDIRVQEVVRLGRTPHRSPFAPWLREDDLAIAQALAQVNLSGHAQRRWHTLSGGERQRVQIARALAQQPSELLLDEPTNHLDIQHQLELLQLIQDLPLTCVMAIHDLNLAAMFCDVLVVLKGGRLVASGAPALVLTERLIAEVYGVHAEVSLAGGRPHVRYRV
ncbi:ABC transporter ATP-binding protein [Pseudomonas sp. CFBP 8771]|uniref:ABC transporter ATP-binding protein n=1 Tax=Pseudomonas sp. CFBP 8771 TaxID=2775285 RepID=UPI001781685C|nr:ABC transporter ATP-binding protein [Pseudomonas sp. CFBP 8771]MBD8601793.1 ABC transporter ATP-binding protein [Pseudomonas sp. CFBP 8771]